MSTAWRKSINRSVTLSNGHRYTYQFFWDGRTRLTGTLDSPISFDLETELIDDSIPGHAPRPVLGTASTGARSVLLQFGQLADFITIHAGQHFCGHNLSFDFRVLEAFLHRGGHHAAREKLFAAMDEGRWHDTMILDQLVRLAKGLFRDNLEAEEAPGEAEQKGMQRRNLGICCKEYCHLEVDKEDEHRTRYAELLEVSDWHALTDTGWWDYAMVDSIATGVLYKRLVALASRLLDEHERLYPKFSYRKTDNLKRFGYLTESLQLRARLALDSMQANGMLADQVKALEQGELIRETCKELVARLEELCPGVVKRKKKTGDICYTVKSRVPQLNRKPLLAHLVAVAEKNGLPVPLSSGKKKNISASSKAWFPYREHDPLISTWHEITRQSKLLGFYDLFRDTPVLRPRYNLLMATGRTSATRPNIQQMPRSNTFRNLFIARPEHQILTIDYSFIELVTLAAICEHRYGFAVLADTIRKGIDPHAYTASLFRGVSLEEFLEMKKTDPDTFKNDRQAAKACFHPDVEMLTSKGWKRVSEITMKDQVANFWPGLNSVEFAAPLALTTRTDQRLYRVSNEGIDLRVTADHRMLGYRSSGYPAVCHPHQMNTRFRGIWNAGIKESGIILGALTEQTLRQAVCIQADGSYSGREDVRFGFTKQRKIDRFRELFPDHIQGHSKHCTAFKIHLNGCHRLILDDEKCFIVDNLLKLPLAFRQAFMDELAYWDSNLRKSNKSCSYCTIKRKNAEAIQAVAAITGFKTVLTITPASGNRSELYTVVVKRRPHTRSGTFQVDELSGLHDVYCLSVPSSFLIVRDGGKPVCVGNCNFGTPGGLGAKKLAAYAKASYSVSMTLEQAAELREKLIKEIYPELNLYLADAGIEALSETTGLTPTSLRKILEVDPHDEESSRILIGYQKVLAGKAEKADGTPYKESFIERTWALYRLIASRSLSIPRWVRKALDKQQPSEKLSRFFQSGSVITLTGRIRANCRYSQAKNSPFQGLAADGAKLAMWKLLKEGFRLLAFVHDELVLELPDGPEQKKQVTRANEIIRTAMEEVLNRKLPVGTEYHLGSCWTK